MSSRLLKSLAMGAVMLALPVLAFAQTARVEGMALQGDYIKDYTGIFTYTSGVTGVGNLIFAELGNTDVHNASTGAPGTLDRGVGAVLSNLMDGRFGTWGIFLRQETPALGQGDAFSQPNPGFGGADPNHNTNESFDLMWGRKTGTTSIGLRLNRSFFKLEDKLPGVTTNLLYDVPSVGGGDPNLGRNIFGIGGGLGFEMNPNSSAEVSILYQTRTFEQSTNPGARNEDDGTTNWQVAGRMMFQWQPNVMIVPVIKFYNFDLGNKVTPVGGTATTFANTLTGWQVGAAGNWTVGSNDLFVLGVTFAQNSLDQQYDVLGVSAVAGVGDTAKVTETLAPQIFAALETHVNNWLTLRFGANKGAYQKIRVEDKGASGEEINLNLSSFNMHIGAGVKLGTLQLDAIVNDQFPQTLGGWFSNAPGGMTAFPKVTATYSF